MLHCMLFKVWLVWIQLPTDGNSQAARKLIKMGHFFANSLPIRHFFLKLCQWISKKPSIACRAIIEVLHFKRFLHWCLKDLINHRVLIICQNERGEGG